MPDDDQTIATTLPAPAPDHSIETPRLATFDHPAERFELGEELGRGGMGRVVAATDVALARSVAIKQVLSKLPDDLIRFEREVRITAELEHPSIVPIHEAARDAEGRPYYVMRRIEGDPLSARLKGPLSTRLTLLPNLLAVVDAAAFAHARNIIHRDIKPSNILLGAYGETHLIDWGLARRLDDLDLSGPRPRQDDQLTRVGHVYGTVGYMAPEQARGEHVDARADVYALGATLFHILAGHGPFAHMADLERLAAAVTGDDRVPLDKLGEDIPPELIAIVDKAMQHERTRRYEHAGELAADLRAFLDGKLVGAHRYSTGERIRRFTRRHRFAVIVAAASLITIAVIAVIAATRVIAGRAVADEQRATASDRAELLAIQRASALAPRDPTRAAALLLELDPATSHHPELARDAIARTAAFGISRGAAIHRGQINGLAFSPDGSQLASVGADGQVVTYEIATGKPTKLVALDVPLSKVGWTDDHTLLVVPAGLGGMLLDIPTRARRPFTTGSMARWWQVGDRIRYFDDRQHAIYDVPLDGGPPRTLAEGVDAASGEGELVVFHTAYGLFVLDRGTTRRLADAVASQPLAFAIRPDGERVAASWRGIVIEWDVATGQPVERWPIAMAVMFDYDPKYLVVYGGTKDLARLWPKGNIVSDSMPASSMWGTRTASGIAFAMVNGYLRVYDGAGVTTMEHDLVGMRILVGSPDRMVIAMGSLDGTVRWIDLDTVAPRPIPIDRMETPCAVAGRFLYSVDPMGLVETDMITGAVRHHESNLGYRSCDTLGSRIVATALDGLSVFEPTSNDVITARGASLHSIDRDRLVYAVGPTIYELAPGARAPHAVHVAPDPILGLTTSGDKTLFVMSEQRAYILDRKTAIATRVAVDGRATRFGLLETGLWYAVANQLFTSDGTSIAPVASPFEQPITSVFHREGSFYVQLEDGSLSVIDPAGAVTQRIAPGIRKLFVGRFGVVEATKSRITSHFLDSGERIARDREMAADAKLVLNGRGTLIRTLDFAVLYVDRVPVDFAAARAWLERETNARIRPNTGAFYWDPGSAR